MHSMRGIPSEFVKEFTQAQNQLSYYSGVTEASGSVSSPLSAAYKFHERFQPVLPH
jgi:hypothetical protein